MIASSISSNSTVSVRKLPEADASAIALLAAAQYDDFEDYWDAPREFVEPINFRRNGWSAVTLLSVPDSNGHECRFYLKRQENQLRYSWRHPLGALSYQFEVDAFHRAEEFQLPTAELVTYGFRKVGQANRGIVVTRELSCFALSHFREMDVQWQELLTPLRAAGLQLLQMHLSGWQHGALYPAHLFIDFDTGMIRLIDLERARRAAPQKAASADLQQFLKRAEWLPDEALAAFLEPYRTDMPGLLNSLSKRFPHRSVALQE